MSQIPEDVMKLAHDAALNFGKLTDRDESNSFLNVADQHELAGFIARAILSDRSSRSIAETGESEATPQTHVTGDFPGFEKFAEYFVRNYPGPDTVIFDPKWHAPKIYRAALSAYRTALATEGKDNG